MEGESHDVLLAGVGGQGIIFAGQILMEAALLQGFSVLGFEEHGMARRGGAVASHIRYGKDIYSPMIPVGFASLLCALEPAEALRHLHFLAPESKVIINTKQVVPNSVSSGGGRYPELDEIIDVIMTRARELYAINATKLAGDAGNPIAMNVVMLGAISASQGLGLSKDSVLEVVKRRSTPGSIKINLKAFELGYEKIIDGA